MFYYDFVLVGPLPRQKSGRITGVQIAFKLFVEALTASEFSVKIVNTALSREKKGRVIGEFNWVRLWSTLKSVGSAVFALLFSRTMYLVISSSLGGFLRDSVLIWWSWLTRSSIILHLHGGGYKDFYQQLPFVLQWFVRGTLDRASSVIVLGDSLREQFYFLSHPERICVVPNGVPHFADHNSFQSKHIPKSPAPIELLYLSNLIPSKGYWDVLAACQKLHESGVYVRCHFAGEFAQINVASDHELFDSVEVARRVFFSTIKEWRLDESVVYHGVVSGKDKEALLKRAHIFILPTYYEWEGQPLSIIEALASGTPVITTQHKAIPDVIQNRENGLFVPPKDPDAIARAVKELCDNLEFYEKLSKQAAVSYKNNFTVETYTKRMMKIVIKQRSS